MFVIRVYYNSYRKLYYNIFVCSIVCNTCEYEGQMMFGLKGKSFDRYNYIFEYYWMMYSHRGIREWITSLHPILYITKLCEIMNNFNQKISTIVQILIWYNLFLRKATSKGNETLNWKIIMSRKLTIRVMN